MRLQVSLQITAIVALGCSRSELKVIDPGFPDQVTFVGAVFLDERGALAASSGLVPRTSGAPLLVTLEERGGDPAALWIYGFVQEDLIDPPDVQALQDAKLFLARDDGPALPNATWVSGFTLDGGETGPAIAPPAPPVAASWLPNCPRLIGSKASVDIGCSPSACAATARQEGCRLVVDADPCLMGQFFVGVDGRGALTFPAIEGAANCRAIETEPQAIFTALCRDLLERDCRIRAYEPQSPRYTVESVAVASGPVSLVRFRPTRGYVSGVVAKTDRVIVSTFDDRFDDWTCSSTSPPSRFVILNPETLGSISTTPAPPCLSWIAPDPMGAGVIGVFGGQTRQVGRFDANGVLTSSVSVGDPSFTVDHAITTLITDDTPPLIALAVSARSGTGQGKVVVLDPMTLAVRGASMPYGARLVSMTHVARGEVAVADDQQEAVHFVDSSARETRAFGLRDTCGTTPLDMADMVAEGRFIHVSSQDSMGEGLYSLSDDGCLRGLPFEGPTIGSGLVSAGPGRLIVGLSGRRMRSGFLALFDTDRNRYLPGLDPVGEGSVTFLNIDERGWIWGATPGTGRVFRAIPR